MRFGSAYEGPPGCVHGGYVAGAFDELLGATQSLSGAPGHDRPAHRQLPLAHAAAHRAAHASASSTAVEGRKIFTNGWLYAPSPTARERLCAEAEGLFISIDFGRFAG